jgi:hypothetical protein
MYCVLFLTFAGILAAQDTSITADSHTLVGVVAMPKPAQSGTILAHSLGPSLAASTNVRPSSSQISSEDAIESLEAEPNDLPQAPIPQSQPSTETATQTKRILGVIPNFRAVSTDQKLPAQSVKEKL